MSEARFHAHFAIGSDHPSLAGHFPGRPVVPAVMLMDHVVTALECQLSPRRLEAIVSAKFIHPVKPQETVEVRFDAVAGTAHSYTFSCVVGSTPVVTGRLRMRQPT